MLRACQSSWMVRGQEQQLGIVSTKLGQSSSCVPPAGFQESGGERPWAISEGHTALTIPLSRIFSKKGFLCKDFVKALRFRSQKWLPWSTSVSVQIPALPLPSQWPRTRPVSVQSLSSSSATWGNTSASLMGRLFGLNEIHGKKLRLVPGSASAQ